MENDQWRAGGAPLDARCCPSHQCTRYFEEEKFEYCFLVFFFIFFLRVYSLFYRLRFLLFQPYIYVTLQRLNGSPCYRWIYPRLSIEDIAEHFPGTKALFPSSSSATVFLFSIFSVLFSSLEPAATYCNVCVCVCVLFVWRSCLVRTNGEDKKKKGKEKKKIIFELKTPKTGIYGQPKGLANWEKGHAWRLNSKSKWTWWIGADQVAFIFFF